MSTRAEVLARFQKDVAAHEMQVVRNDGINRHLRFKKPGTGCMYFDIVTWSGILVITGDMGTSVFTRIEDMFQFFRPGRDEHRDGEGKLFINPGYWAEKCIANDGPKEEFSTDRWAKVIKERFDQYFQSHGELSPADELEKAELWEKVQGDVIDGVEDQSSAFHAADCFDPENVTFGSLRFDEMWDYTLTDYRWHFIWRLYAIAYAIQQFDAWQAAAAQAARA